MREQSHFFCRWREGAELEWFVFPTVTIIVFEDCSFSVVAQFLKLEAGYYGDRSEYAE